MHHGSRHATTFSTPGCFACCWRVFPEMERRVLPFIWILQHVVCLLANKVVALGSRQRRNILHALLLKRPKGSQKEVRNFDMSCALRCRLKLRCNWFLVQT